MWCGRSIRRDYILTFRSIVINMNVCTLWTMPSWLQTWYNAWPSRTPLWGGLYTTPLFPSRLCLDSVGLDLSRMPIFWLWNCWNCLVTVWWLSSACLSDYWVQWTFLADSPAGISPNQQANPLEITGQQRKVQQTAAESPTDNKQTSLLIIIINKKSNMDK